MDVGVVGLGIMGYVMAERLLEAGHNVRVHNRTRSKAEALVARGALWAGTPAEAALADVVVTMVSDPTAVAEVSLGDRGILAGLPPESVHCDMSTVSTASARHMAETYHQQSLRFVQAPVLGSKRQVQEGSLLVFGGGTEEDVAVCEIAWSAFAKRTWHLPSAEQAATTKLACNILISQMILGLGQSLVFAKQGGVDPALLLDVLANSALGAPMYASKGKTLLERNFEANFFVRHMVKDLSLAADAGRDAGAPLLLNGLARELFVSATAQGWGDEDYSAVVKVLERMAGTEIGR
jgi:3-hydroxyisobutyrate dehydrogenase-like beta-hydroxyacid dehydrogenase